MPTPEQQALAALLSFSRTARVDGRMIEGFYRLGESPEDHGYHVKVTLSVHHDAASKAYSVTLTVNEERIESGFVSHRHGYGMAQRDLGTVAASRFSVKRLEQIYNQTLDTLKHGPAVLIDLLREESER
jgi:hypothetical protein